MDFLLSKTRKSLCCGEGFNRSWFYPDGYYHIPKIWNQRSRDLEVRIIISAKQFKVLRQIQL